MSSNESLLSSSASCNMAGSVQFTEPLAAFGRGHQERDRHRVMEVRVAGDLAQLADVHGSPRVRIVVASIEPRTRGR
jgi:hypothetical protein